MAIEPNRWGTISPDRAPQIRLAQWVDAIAGAGFDGLEVWDGHLTAASSSDAAAVLDGPLPISVFNSYAGFEAEGAEARTEVAAWVARTGAWGVKFNVGNDPAAADAYAERLAAWIDELPAAAVALCECHHGISIAEDPSTAAAIFDAAAPPDRLGAIVHTHEDADQLRARFDAYGERICHVHVNHLDTAAMTHPALAEVADRLHETVELLRSLGFAGTWTLEFVAGLLTDRDEPGALIDQAALDLPVLREALGSGS